MNIEEYPWLLPSLPSQLAGAWLLWLIRSGTVAPLALFSWRPYRPKGLARGCSVGPAAGRIWPHWPQLCTSKMCCLKLNMRYSDGKMGLKRRLTSVLSFK